MVCNLPVNLMQRVRRLFSVIIGKSKLQNLADLIGLILSVCPLLIQRLDQLLKNIKGNRRVVMVSGHQGTETHLAGVRIFLK